MRNFYVIVFAFLSTLCQAQIVNIPDANFKHQLINSSGVSPYQLAKDAAGNWLAVDANDDGEIQVSEAQQVDWLFVSSAFGWPYSPVASLVGIEYFTNLRTIDINQSDIVTLNFSGCAAMEKIDLNGASDLLTLNVSGLSNLNELIVHGSGQLQSILFLANSALKTINLNDTPGLPADLTALTALETLIYKYVDAPHTVNVAGMPNLKSLDCSYSAGLTSISMSGAGNLETVSLRNTALMSLDVSGLPALKTINCSNTNIAALDLTPATSLESVACGGQSITSLNIQNLVNLKYLACGFTSMDTIDLTGLVSLETLQCAAGVPTGNLISLPLAQVPSLKTLNCGYNPITSLDLSAVPLLQTLDCSACDLAELDFTGCYNLTSVSVQGNSITSLDASKLRQLNSLAVHNNPLVYLNVKNGRNESLVLNNCVDLDYICADESQIAAVQQNLNTLGLTACNLNSYCSFEPGGEYFTVFGNVRVDGNLDGCEESDYAFEHLQLRFNADGNETSVITNGQGIYSFPVTAGTYTVSPVLENDSYFTSLPASATVGFPQDSSPYQLDFCLLPNGEHPDLETSILPLTAARPGFNATYRVVFKNKGNITMNGSVSFSYDEAVSDLVTVSLAADAVSAGSLTWNFTNLAPMESRWVNIVLNHNSPMETPALNAGSQINFLSVINPVAGDELPVDNTFALKQIMVNSLDPNDKVCLEGSVISPSQVGEYVHYLIRFENTGTFAAQNVVVRDLIDTSKFDVASLVPISSSHAFETRITQNNRVEFLFENIQLPFDDANNDGFIAFKIKTKPQLAIGESFSNMAGIYFDFNFPVLTDPAVTTIQQLSVGDFEFSDYFTLYPNPVADRLTVRPRYDAGIRSLSIYSISGQIVLTAIGADTEAVDVSSLRSGTYFIKIFTDKGASVAKFLKE